MDYLWYLLGRQVEAKLMYDCKVNTGHRLVSDHALGMAMWKITFCDGFCHEGPRPLGFYPDWKLRLATTHRNGCLLISNPRGSLVSGGSVGSREVGGSCPNPLSQVLQLCLEGCPGTEHPLGPGHDCRLSKTWLFATLPRGHLLVRLPKMRSGLSILTAPGW